LVTYNIGTKEHDDEELNSFSSCPWGPPTLEHIKKMSSSSSCPWDLQHLNKKMHDNKELRSSLSCVEVTCSIETKEHDDEELRSSLSCPWGPLALEQTKNMTMRSQAFYRHVPGI
jgi:hypothetical protein